MTASPILLLIFNRPDLTALVMETIRRAAPSRLYIAADGPRELPGEIDLCQQARQIASSVDWPCEVHRLFRDRNLGLRLGVSSALDWFFEGEESGIVLEDDCVPHRSFFPYCDELLDYYRHDTRIMAISGDNFQTEESINPYSYYFSRYFHCWGWATWSRAWVLFDRDMRLWPKFREAGMLRSWCHDEPQFEAFWTSAFDNTDGLKNTWAVRYLFTCWAHNGLTCIPRVNLVTNVGFRNDGTNAIDPSSPLAGLVAREIEFPLHHPPFVCRAVDADRAVQRNCFGPPPPPKVATRPQTESGNGKSRSAAIAQLKEKVRQLEDQLHSRTAQSEDRVRHLEEQLANTKLALDEARRLCHNVRSSLSWRLTWPLRVLRDAIATGLRGRSAVMIWRKEGPHDPATPRRNLRYPVDPALLINSFYKTAFGCLADPEGLANRVEQLQSGVTLRALAEEFVASAEFQARHGLSQNVDTEFLEALYRDGLGREPDPEGLERWLAEGGKEATRAEVLAAFGGSTEAIEKLANLYVCSLYRTAFGRNPDGAGLANCIKQLQSGSSLEDLAQGVAVSPEFQGRHSQTRKVSAEYLTALYRDGLGREPDPEGLASWLAEAQHGATPARVLAAFAGSHEALQKAESMTSRQWKGVLLPPASLTPCGRLTDTPENFYLSACQEADRLAREFGLSETSEILDIGCGVGRLAIGIKARGLAFGSYLGIDVSSKRIEWCVSNLAPTDNRLKFRFIDMKNERYNPSGRIGLNLSLPNDSVDVVYNYSVFTHLPEGDMREYLKLISDVLRPSGKCFVTMFVADGVPPVTHNPTNFAPIKWTGPLHCVLYERSYWLEILKAAGFEVVREEQEINIDGQTGYILRRTPRSIDILSTASNRSPFALVGFFGLNRSERWTLASIKSNIFEPLKAYGFEQIRVAHFNAPEVIHSPRSGEHSIPHVNVSANNFGLELSWVEPQSEENLSEYLSIVLNTPIKGEDDHAGIIRRNALQQLHSLRRLGQILDLLTLERFDLFCFFRPDLLYIDQIPIEGIWKLIHADGVDIITPSWHRWGGFNDRFAFCSRRGADIYLNRIKWLPELCRRQGTFHSESLLRFAVESEELVFDFVNMRAKRVRATGTVQEENFDM
jgi:SAM-dependent methyltransferase